ncbi:MAG: DUF6364 family protein [Gammaproteobacteria bacterium]
MAKKTGSITVRLDEQLSAKAKQYAHENGKTLTSVIEDALREVLARRDRLQHRSPVKLTTVGRGLHGGIDRDDSASLLAVTEQRDGTASLNTRPEIP